MIVFCCIHFDVADTNSIYRHNEKTEHCIFQNFISMYKVLILLVKYMREVSPYFRKSSALNDLGWGGQKAQNEAARANWNESKTIPLKLCYLCRNLSMADPEKKTLELHSPDGKSSCILRFPDPATASDWFNLIHAKVSILMRQCIEEANHIVSSGPNSGEIKHIGWLAEQVLDLYLRFGLFFNRICEMKL